MLNTECIFLDFFDGHDIWHFLGGSGEQFCNQIRKDILNKDFDGCLWFNGWLNNLDSHNVRIVMLLKKFFVTIKTKSCLRHAKLFKKFVKLNCLIFFRIIWRKRSSGFLRIFTVVFFLFLTPAGGSNPAGANFLTL